MKYLKIKKSDIKNGIEIVHSKPYLVFREKLINSTYLQSLDKGTKQ